MKTRTKKLFGLLSIAMLLSFLLGCSFFNSKGTISLSLTDAPISDDAGVEGVYITITAIEYNLNDEWITDTNFEGPQEFNLLELTNGEVAPLSNLTIEAGEVSQIRFLLDSDNGLSKKESLSGCYIAIDNDGIADGDSSDDTKYNLEVPSGDQTGYKANGPFTVPMNGSVEITADFDVRKSVIKKGNENTYKLKPTIRLIVNNQAGSINGTFNITSSESYDSYTIFVYENDSYDNSEETAVDEESPVFPNAISSSQVIVAEEEDDDTYILPFLEANTYDLIIVGFKAETETTEASYTYLDEISDVLVQEGTVTQQNIDINLSNEE